jgi:Ca2+-binding RTX toxin-like protein
MELILAPYLALFLGTLGFELGLMNRNSEDEDALPADSTAEDSAPLDDTPAESSVGTGMTGGSSGTTLPVAPLSFQTPEAAASAEETLPDADAEPDAEPGAEPDEVAEPAFTDNPAFVAGAYADTIFGSDEDDTLSPEAELDLAFFLGEGDDSLDTGRGNDYAEGGAGDDVMFLRQGDDLAYGGAGDDRIDLGQGEDRGFGGTGDDTMSGNGGDDVIRGEAGHDLLLGGTGSDALHGGRGNDTLAGMSLTLATPVANKIADGFDSLYGGAGDDLLILGPGDQGWGGSGDDLFQLDHRRSDLTSISIVQDFTPGDAVELLYTPETSDEGRLIAPVVDLVANAAGTGLLILFNGQPVADLIGVSDLAPEAIRLTPYS